MGARDIGPRVSCILPAYNEANSIGPTVAEWAAVLETCTRDYEIIAIDDGSRDGTGARLRQLVSRYPRLRVLSHERNLGYGAAIANGFAQARFALLFFTDSDGQYEPDDFPLLLAGIRHADLAVGYRVRRADPFFRSLLSRGYNLLARRVIGVSLRDLNCAFKLIHRDAFRRLGVAATDFIVNAELALNARQAGMRIAEIPVRHRPRRAGRTTVRPIHVLAGLYGLACLRLGRRFAPPARQPASEEVAALPAALRSDDVATPQSLAR